MSAALSRRLAKVVSIPPLLGMDLLERNQLAVLAYRLKEFTDLPERYQQLILEAEANRERLIAERNRAASR